MNMGREKKGWGRNLGLHFNSRFLNTQTEFPSMLQFSEFCSEVPTDQCVQKCIDYGKVCLKLHLLEK